MWDARGKKNSVAITFIHKSTLTDLFFNCKCPLYVQFVVAIDLIWIILILGHIWATQKVVHLQLNYNHLHICTS